ncbi:MAG TPA: hypothetical protein VL970_13715 [Candidatus Acidoferrales bacterium]|nr:hypothetical protein [Candidatus Acidoferrales bacterium]
MFKCIRALSVAGLATISSSQLTLSANQNVFWSPDKDNADVLVGGVKEAARAISRVNNLHPTVRFTSHAAGGTALVPLWPYNTGGRCSPNFDPAPFRTEKGSELWASFEFVNIQPADRELIAFAIKADKPGCKDRFRTDHDIGNGRIGNKSSMSAMLATPAEGDCGYYFLERGILQADELLERNPGAAIRVTISNRTPGREA